MTIIFQYKQKLSFKTWAVIDIRKPTSAFYNLPFPADWASLWGVTTVPAKPTHGDV